MLTNLLWKARGRKELRMMLRFLIWVSEQMGVPASECAKKNIFEGQIMRVGFFFTVF